MDCVDALRLCDRDNSGDVQIRLNRSLALANQVRFIRFKPVQRKPVFIGIHRNRAQPEFIRGAEDTNRDFAAVCRQQLLYSWTLGHTCANTLGSITQSVTEHSFTPATNRYSSFFDLLNAGFE